MKVKHNTLKDQRTSAELESIVEDFASAMRNADRRNVTRLPNCIHDMGPRFTLHMHAAWDAYIAFCTRNPVEKA